MASEPVLSREVGNRTSFVDHPVMVISGMMLFVLQLDFQEFITILTTQLILKDCRKNERISRSKETSAKEGKEAGYIYTE